MRTRNIRYLNVHPIRFIILLIFCCLASTQSASASAQPMPQRVQLVQISSSSYFTDSGQALGDSVSWDVVLGDLDGDNDLDAFVVNEGQPNKIWLNDGSGVFSDSGQNLDNPSRSRAIVNPLGPLIGNRNRRSNSAQSYSAALGDIDNDGDLDAFVTNYGQPNTLWLNDGAAIFSDSGQRLGNGNSWGVALEDIDGDNDLDAFVANVRQPNTVWLNDGAGNFSDSGQALGNLTSYSVALEDLDQDGDHDAFVTNYFEPNQLWINDGTGRFTDSGQSLGEGRSVSASLGDVDGDGDLDALVGNWQNEPNALWLNDGAGQFSHSGQSIGEFRSYGVPLGDFDEDGRLDLFSANYNQPNKLWQNVGAGIFTDSGQALGDGTSFGAALGDVDGDGDLDAFVANHLGQPNKVWLYMKAPLAPAQLPQPATPETAPETVAPEPPPTTTLAIADRVFALAGASVVVPISLTTKLSDAVASLVFSIDFDESCLSFDVTDANEDDIPDSAVLNLPNEFVGSVNFDAADLDGEIDVVILDPQAPLTALSDGILLTLRLIATCQPAPEEIVLAAVQFATEPPVSLGNTQGQGVLNIAYDGSIEIHAVQPSEQNWGDCNGDEIIDAGDISCLVLEIFDGDGVDPNDTLGGTHPGRPTSDANQDSSVDAGDIACTVLIIFDAINLCE